jgi:leucyl-tRNA synthetase
MVLAPEHPLVDRITPSSHRETVDAYRTMASAKSDRDRMEGSKDKTGCFTGAHAINPINDERLPIYIADYVMMGYGTGAIMAVPGHDERDFEFAKKFDIPIKLVVGAADGTAIAAPFAGEGVAVNSPIINGLMTVEAKERITEALGRDGVAVKTTKYKLRDWLFSRQRYWGEPFPIVLDAEGDAYAIDEANLPLVLPQVEDFKPTGTPEPPLSKAKEWLAYSDKAGRQYVRETNVMPQWAGSCWYYLRYIDPKNETRFVDPAKEKYWMPVDLYIGGVEHAVLHLLYARFWHKVLFDLGHVSTAEPFMRLVNQGLILGEDSQKMSKSRGNVVNPDDIVRDYGADAFRLYEMYLGPLEAQKPWNTKDIVGMSRFLGGVWNNLANDEEKPVKIEPTPIPDAVDRLMHKTIKKVGEDIEALRFNTAIAELIVLNKEIGKLDVVPRELAENFTLMLAPFAPHIAEEIWSRLGHTKSLTRRPWPSYDPAKLVESTLEIPVQVNGKLRDKITVPADLDSGEILFQAAAAEKVKPWLDGKVIKKKLYVPKKLVNFVVGD